MSVVLRRRQKQSIIINAPEDLLLIVFAKDNLVIRWVVCEGDYGTGTYDDLRLVIVDR